MLIDATTSAVTKELNVMKGSVLFLFGTPAASNITIEMYDGTSVWSTVVMNSVTQQLNSTNNTWVSPFECKIRVNKPGTASACGVRLMDGGGRY